MSKELIERLRELSKRRCIGTYDEAADRIEELEREVERKMSAADFILKERDQLREQVKMLRDALLTCSVGDFSTGHVIHPSFDEKLVEEALAATELQQ